MAKKLHVSAGTVRNRIQVMYASGFLLGSSVHVNPTLIGLKAAAFGFDADPSTPKTKVIDALKLVDGILFIHNYHGSFIGSLFVYADERELMRKLSLLRSFSGTNQEVFSSVPYPPCTADLTDPERTLVSRLSKGSFASYSELARELETSVRTLKRRMEKIIRAWAVLSTPTLDYRAIVGGVPADLIVLFTNPAAKDEAQEKILRLVGDYLVLAGGTSEDLAVYNLIVPSMQIASDLAPIARRIDGVKMVRAELVAEHIDLTVSLEELIRRKGKERRVYRLHEEKMQRIKSQLSGS